MRGPKDREHQGGRHDWTLAEAARRLCAVACRRRIVGPRRRRGAVRRAGRGIQHRADDRLAAGHPVPGSVLGGPAPRLLQGRGVRCRAHRARQSRRPDQAGGPRAGEFQPHLRARGADVARYRDPGGRHRHDPAQDRLGPDLARRIRHLLARRPQGQDRRPERQDGRSGLPRHHPRRRRPEPRRFEGHRSRLCRHLAGARGQGARLPFAALWRVDDDQHGARQDGQEAGALPCLHRPRGAAVLLPAHRRQRELDRAQPARHLPLPPGLAQGARDLARGRGLAGHPARDQGQRHLHRGHAPRERAPRQAGTGSRPTGRSSTRSRDPGRRPATGP